VTTYPRRDQHGNLVPFLADWLTGKREADRLAEHGLTVDQDRVSLTVLGRAVADQEPPDQRPDLAEQLATAQGRNRLQRRDLEQQQTAPEAGEAAPEVFGVEEQRGLDHGLPSTAQREQDKKSNRNVTVEDFLAEARDEYDDWS
jgi:hypothetical protein